MITPNQIREKKISTVESGGYDRDEVNTLLLDVIESYEAVFAENKELYRKMEILANKIEEYRADEDYIKSALITAQKMASKMENEAKEKADDTLAKSAASAQQTVVDAKEKADKIIGEARDYVASLTKEKTEAAEEIIAQAQKKANDAIDGANVVANNTLIHAKKLADEIVKKAKAYQDYHSEIVSKLKSESNDFKAAIISLYEAQLEKINEIPDAVIKPEYDAEGLNTIENELNNLIGDIEEQAVEEEIVEDAEDIEAIEETKEVQDIAAEEESVSDDSEEILQNEEESTTTDNEIDEIIEEIESMEEPVFQYAEEDEELPSAEEVEDALASFTNDEITPVDENAKSIPVIEDEPEFESEMPFENFFNVNKGHENIDETISLIPPEDDEDDNENSRFKGFFKKKK